MLHVTHKLVLQAKLGESGNRPQVNDRREFNSFTKCCPRNYIIFSEFQASEIEISIHL